MSQESITDLEGFGKALKLDCTTADTSIASNELLLLYQKFEGQFVQKMQKGFSTAKPVTVSFYVKGNANATYVAELLDQDNSNRHINKTFSVTTSWSRVSLTFPGDTTGKLDSDNASSLRLNIWLHGGSDYTGGTLQTSWGSIVGANRAAGITSFFDSTDREFFITGVQMELGEVATPFETIPFGDNLARCQRYYSKVQYSNWSGRVASGNAYYIHDGFRQTMRANPTASILSQSQSTFPTDRSFGDMTTNGVGTQCTAPSNADGAYWYTGIALDAEL